MDDEKPALEAMTDTMPATEPPMVAAKPVKKKKAARKAAKKAAKKDWCNAISVMVLAFFLCVLCG